MKQLRDTLNLSKSNSVDTDLEKTRIARNEADVKWLIAMLESNWINPFSAKQQDLVCLFTGKVATQKVEEGLLGAKAIRKRHKNNLVHSAWRQIRQSNFTRP